MKKIKAIFLNTLCLLFLFILPISAQQKIMVKGNVSSYDDGTPLVGVSVLVKDQPSKWVVTNSKGDYTIKVNKGSTLIFEFIGMEKQTIKVNKSVINIRLHADVKQLDEAVAIGYGMVKKKEFAGANTHIKADQLEDVVSYDLGVALQGQIAGLNVTSSAGDPGSVSNIQIRGITSISGSNTPLFVVDGVPQEGNPEINSSEIESLDVLKDAASCSIYGTRGAAGVILITTKQGKAGKMKVAINSTYGWQEINYNKLPDVMDTREQTYAEILYRENLNPTQDDMETNFILKKNDFYYMNNTDVMDMILKNGARPEQNYTVNMSGGSNAITYNVNLGYYDQDGVLINSGYKRYTMRTNIGYGTKKFHLNISNSFKYDKTSIASGTSLGQALHFFPFTPEIDRNATSFEVATDQDYSIEVSPVSQLLRSFNTSNVTNRQTYSIAVKMTYDITKELKFNTNIGINSMSYMNEFFVPYADITNINGDIIDPGSSNSRVQNRTVRNMSYNWFGGLNWTHKFNKDHKLTLTSVMSYENYDSKGFYAGKWNVQYNDINVLNGAVERPYAYNTTYYDNKLLGFIARAQYSYKNGRYLLSTSIRADASSKFSADNRWGYFPSVSVGWNVASEPFWKGLRKTWNVLKFRASYGTTGNQSFSPYSYINTASTGYDYAGADGTTNYGTTQVSYPVPEVQWETSKQYNVGFDAGLFDNKLTIIGDFYYSNKSDMLATVQLPLSVGAGSSSDAQITENIGDMVNKGVELTIGYRYTNGKFSIKNSLNLSKNVNEITKLGNNKLIYNPQSKVISEDPNSMSTVFAEGYEAGAFFLYKTAGIANTQEKLDDYKNKYTGDWVAQAELGDLMFVDANNDGMITNDDRTYCGSGMPDVELGYNMNLQYKNFDFTMNWYASLGNDILNGAEAMSFYYNRNVKLLSQWSEANPTSEIPSYRNDGKNHFNYIAYSDLWVEDGSFLRLKVLTLGYTLPKKWLGRLPIGRIHIYATGQNLLTLTGYNGMDPEIGGNGLSTRGIDKGGYPVSKKYMMGVQINF